MFLPIYKLNLLKQPISVEILLYNWKYRLFNFNIYLFRFSEKYCYIWKQLWRNSCNSTMTIIFNKFYLLYTLFANSLRVSRLKQGNCCRLIKRITYKVHIVILQGFWNKSGGFRFHITLWFKKNIFVCLSQKVLFSQKPMKSL